MENHRRNIEKLCRICDRKVTTGKVYWNANDVVDYVDVDSIQLKCVPAPSAIFKNLPGLPCCREEGGD